MELIFKLSSSQFFFVFFAAIPEIPFALALPANYSDLLIGSCAEGRSESERWMISEVAARALVLSVSEERVSRE